MRTKRWMVTCVVALLSVTAVLAKDIRVVVFKVSQMHCEKCEKKVRDNMRFEKGLKDISTEVKTKMVTITYDAEKTNVKKLQAGFNKFKYEAEFVKETKKDNQKADKK
ncbi:heavy-metal-associated domain-containing protein [Bacteroides caecimuris]|jgi:copper chaperone CopZ|uniref:Cation transporter n=1 Tax=Bacteroides caecimuris TaxID=1796613 RepID=A0A1C7H1I7_9BACE|nr:heavy-metal-associated domain-containing protein [Bacteroides caecimuris]ANU57397.1 heavy metal-binding protein [Bacteroides caecimuris]OXE61459.1 cation transporter [Bacteroides caecimuris]QQR17730.1 cation transporter [Bacteroides caecimuris]TGY30712.1 cation transporter [Bacteroides caecimuris]UQA30728.1 heavy-metal-associated domain-containing protein [Bacteroides caecimuris]